MSRASFCTVSQSFSICGGIATVAEEDLALVEDAEMAALRGNLGTLSAG